MEKEELKQRIKEILNEEDKRNQDLSLHSLDDDVEGLSELYFDITVKAIRKNFESDSGEPIATISRRSVRLFDLKILILSLEDFVQTIDGEEKLRILTQQREDREYQESEDEDEL